MIKLSVVAIIVSVSWLVRAVETALERRDAQEACGRDNQTIGDGRQGSLPIAQPPSHDLAQE